MLGSSTFFEAISSLMELADGSTIVTTAILFISTLFLFMIAMQPYVPDITVPLEPAETDEPLTGPSFKEMQLKDASRPGFIQCYDPSTLQKLGEVVAMTPDQVNACVEKATAAQKSWALTSFKERRRVLAIMQKYIVTHQDDIIRVAMRDSGKADVDALLGEILVTCEKIRCTSVNGEAWLKRESRPVGPMMVHKNAYVEYHPLGVIGVIAPWNYPFHNMYNHIISGIFSGNAVVSKCSEYTSWSSRYFSAIIREILAASGHNPDLCQTITGFGEAGAALVANPGVHKIIFTGSPEVGKRVAQAAAPLLKPVVLELGGKDPMVVCEDASLSEVIPMVMRGVYQNCGQNCIGIERVFLYEGIYDKFCAAAVEAVGKLRQGLPLGPSQVDCGALVMPAQIDVVQRLVDDAVAKGAKLLAGGKRNPKFPNGLFYEPTILADVTKDMKIANEEVFGPVMCIIKVPGNSDSTAISMINESPYGLGSSVFSANQARATKIGHSLRCGMTTINDFGVNYMVQSLPFGGVKDSGYLRFAGPEGLRECCLMKAVVVDKVSFIRTTIPGILQCPLGPGAYMFSKAMVSVVFGPSILARIRGVIDMIRATLVKPKQDSKKDR